MRCKSLLVSAFVAAALVGCTGNRCPLQNADLVFVRDGGSLMDAAITAATGSEAESFSHVAIIEVVKDEIFVIEAAPELGVVRRPFAEFKADNCKGSISESLVFKRIKPEIVQQLADSREVAPDQILSEFVEVAKTMVGLPYDFYYLPMNGMEYCSELVYDSYVEMTPKPWDPHLFQASPMNFYDADGELPDFWKFSFEEILEVPVPQGVPGTNPNTMSQEPILMDIEGVERLK